MNSMGIWHLLLLLAVVLVAVQIHHTRNGARRIPHRQDTELHPVFSAETHRGTEAEFVNERLPVRVPIGIIALIVTMAAFGYLWA